MMRTAAAIVALSFTALTCATLALAAGADPSRPHPPPDAATCETARVAALHRCAHYTDAGRDRCDAKVQKDFADCMSHVPKPHGP